MSLLKRRCNMMNLYKEKHVQVDFSERSADDKDSGLHYCAYYLDTPHIHNVYCWGETRIEALSKLQMFEEHQLCGDI